jgi:hypothetical protein
MSSEKPNHNRPTENPDGPRNWGQVIPTKNNLLAKYKETPEGEPRIYQMVLVYAYGKRVSGK